MSATPTEPANLVLEHLRLMRAEMHARFDAVDALFDAIDAHFFAIKRELRCLKLNTIAEVF